MQTLVLLVVLSASVGAQYHSRYSTTTEIPLSELAKLSPRAGPDRKQAAYIQSPTVRTLGAFGALGQGQLVGSNGAYALTVRNQEAVPRSQFQGYQTGYAVTEAPEDEAPQQAYQIVPQRVLVPSPSAQPSTGQLVSQRVFVPSPTKQPSTVQLVPQRVLVPSPTKQPTTVHQFEFPVKGQPQLQQHLFVPYDPKQPEQFLRETSPLSISSNSPINFPQSPEQNQPTYPLQQQYYEQEPSLQYVQHNPSVTVSTPSPLPVEVSTPSPLSVGVSTPSPLTKVTLFSGNEQSYPSPIIQIRGDVARAQDPSANLGNALRLEAYSGRPLYQAIPANSVPNLEERSQYTPQYPVSGFVQRQLLPRPGKVRPILIPSSAAGFQQGISQTGDQSYLSQGIYNYNQATADTGAQQQLKVLSYPTQQPIAGATYGVQGSFSLNPVDYASPFARQEILESRNSAERKNHLNSHLGKLSDDGEYDYLVRGEEKKNINAFQGPSYPVYG
ncbi:hypothetical protein J437_LFUL009822 [Ladona fulva]|uniref:Uncharacterized protein n=1 Tax=Ladona fulva TaxID=123851 RepID=A0A8K0K7C1_LADFU|nr:hypothetical protein J437_LFUL009822 [Ladona fulva]